jgi:hypothetical protein
MFAGIYWIQQEKQQIVGSSINADKGARCEVPHEEAKSKST